MEDTVIWLPGNASAAVNLLTLMLRYRYTDTGMTSGTFIKCRRITSFQIVAGQCVYNMPSTSGFLCPCGLNFAGNAHCAVVEHVQVEVCSLQYMYIHIHGAFTVYSTAKQVLKKQN